MLKKIFCWVLITLGIFGLAATVAALSVTNGVNIGTVLPGISGLVLGAYGIFRLRHNGPLFRNKIVRIVVTTLVCLGLALFVLIEALIITAASTPPSTEEADYVVVLGCGIFPDGHLSLSLKTRLDEAYDYLIAHPYTRCIVTGGQGDNEPRPEADAMKDYLMARGIDADRIDAERESTSTEENLAYALAIMRAHAVEDSLIAIATNDYHVYRARLVARELGLRSFGLPAKTPLAVRISSYMRECLALIDATVFHVGSEYEFLKNF